MKIPHQRLGVKLLDSWALVIILRDTNRPSMRWSVNFLQIYLPCTYRGKEDNSTEP